MPTSPFLTFDTCKLLASRTRETAHQFSFFTTLDPSAVANGHLPVQGLKAPVQAGISVHHLERLHAQRFIIGTRAILGSANLTGAGLVSSARSDRELGVELAEGPLADAHNTNRGLWLKFEYEEPALEAWKEKSYFASPKKGRPSFNVGDLVNICAHATK